MSLPEEITLQVEASLSFGKRVELAVSRVLSWAIIPLDQQSLTDSSNLPDPHAGHTLRDPIWSCSEWGLPCHALLPGARCALTAPFQIYRNVAARLGILLSVALSLRLPSPAVSWHRVSLVPGLSSPYGLATLVERGHPGLVCRPYMQGACAGVKGASKAA